MKFVYWASCMLLNLRNLRNLRVILGSILCMPVRRTTITWACSRDNNFRLNAFRVPNSTSSRHIWPTFGKPPNFFGLSLCNLSSENTSTLCTTFLCLNLVASALSQRQSKIYHSHQRSQHRSFFSPSQRPVSLILEIDWGNIFKYNSNGLIAHNCHCWADECQDYVMEKCSNILSCCHDY